MYFYNYNYFINRFCQIYQINLLIKNADLDIPPNHALFSIMHSVKITRKSSLGFLSNEFIQMRYLLHLSLLSLSQSTPSPLLYNYSNYNSDIQNRSFSLSLTSDHSLFSQISD